MFILNKIIWKIWYNQKCQTIQQLAFFWPPVHIYSTRTQLWSVTMPLNLQHFIKQNELLCTLEDSGTHSHVLTLWSDSTHATVSKHSFIRNRSTWEIKNSCNLQAVRTQVWDPTRWMMFINLSNPANHIGPGVYSTSNRVSTRDRNMFLGRRAWPVCEAHNLTTMCKLSV
jgi:hypothetical protein